MKNQHVSIAGACLLALGSFLPAIHLPLVGSVSFALGGHGDGTLVAALAIIGGILALSNRVKSASVTGLLALVIVAYDFTNFSSAMGSLKENPFARTVTLGEAWPVMFVGAIAMIVASFMKGNRAPRSEVPTPIPHRGTGWNH